ncbi:hypothetical protein TRICI_003010 [Trichomonascus ciferrii]|uniref:MICOS complex subunit MIC19 n=1 Tax=Trichomonascus ciferrii TaxID=44093 RepID=A0A642V4A8_9ASCO|nr:hypothetical protein TRICI_003010 [Trichomonascus ciferrii]
MGAGQSKQEQSKVFLPQTPTEFSNALVSKLDSTLEKYIQDRVNNELHTLEKESRQALEDALQKVPAPSKELEEDSASLKEKLTALKAQLDARPKKAEYPAELAKARNDLVQCFKDNKGRALNCAEQLDAFKTQINNLNTN